MFKLSCLVVRLSGESPFQGSSDVETLALVTAGTWEFDLEFDDITDEAKDFICKLLKKERGFVHFYFFPSLLCGCTHVDNGLSLSLSLSHTGSGCPANKLWPIRGWRHPLDESQKP